MLSQEEQDYQEEIRRLQDIDLRCMKMPTRMSQIANSVQVECNPMPDDALPRWLKLPLNHKLPVIPCPPGQFKLSRNRIGKSLFGCKPCREFDIEDPYIRRTPHRYEPLHDPNLKAYYIKHPTALRNLERRGFLNQNHKVDCSISDFNKYRDYLSRLHGSCINNERERQDRVHEADQERIKKIRQYLKKEETSRKESEVKARRDESKAARGRRNMKKQVKEREHPRICYRQRLAILRSYQSQQRDYLIMQRAARREQMKLDMVDKNRKLVLEWYCQDLYSAKLRQSLIDYRQKSRINNLDSYVKCKRDYQERKLRYERAILLRKKIEKQCGINKRRDHYADLEVNRKVNLKRRAEEAQRKADRELYLMRKYGRKWLAFVAAKRSQQAVFQDSLWHIRQNMREMVKILREESGAVSFTSFIQGLVKMKPGKDSIQMNEDERDVISFVINCILDRVNKECVRRSTTCALDFMDQETRKKMARFECPRGNIIPMEDFIPPETKRCFVPDIPFEKPCRPCTGPCADLEIPAFVDQEWRRRCADMTRCLTEVPKKTQSDTMKCFARLVKEMCTEHRREKQRRKDAFGGVKPRPCLDTTPESAPRKRTQASAPCPPKEIQTCGTSKEPCPFKGIQTFKDPSSLNQKAYSAKPSCRPSQQTISAKPSCHPSQQAIGSQPPPCSSISTHRSQSEPRLKSPYKVFVPQAHSVPKLADRAWNDWEKRCAKMAECLSEIHAAVPKHPGLDRSPSDDSFVEQIIKEQLLKLQHEKDVCLNGNESEIDEIADDENLSRVSSNLVNSSICASRSSAPCLSPSRTSSGESFVENIINEQRKKLQHEKDVCLNGNESEIDELADDENISRVSSNLVNSSICASRSSHPCLSPDRTSSDESFVEKIIAEQVTKLQHEKDVCQLEDFGEIEELVDEEIISRVASAVVDSTLCAQVGAMGSCEKKSVACLRPSKMLTSGDSFTDSILDDQVDKLQHEKDVIAGGDETLIDEIAHDENVSRLSSGIVKNVICQQARLLDSCNDPPLYLDPNEEGISPVRSEIRSSLNRVRQELEEMKRQLSKQGK